MQCFLDTRALKQASHQSKSLTQASKPPNSKHLLLVEVHRAESLVDEVVGPLLGLWNYVGLIDPTFRGAGGAD